MPNNWKLWAIMGSNEQKEEYQKLNWEIEKIKMLDKEIAVSNHKYRAMKQVEKQWKQTRMEEQEIEW